jgi:hypothetical protein
MAEQFLSGRAGDRRGAADRRKRLTKSCGDSLLCVYPQRIREIEAAIFEYPFETMRQPVRPNVERLRRRGLVGMNYEELHLLIDKPRGIGICC